MPISQSFQSRFRELTDERGKNRTQIAADMNITYVLFSKAYNYGILPRPAVLVRIADYFEVSLDFLLGKAEENSFVPARERASFAKRLEELRQKKQISVYRLAEQTHIHRNNIAGWLNKGYLPSLEDLEILSDYFGVTLDCLLGRTKE